MERKSYIIFTFFNVHPKLLQLLHKRFQRVDVEDNRFVTKCRSNTTKTGWPYAMNCPNAFLRWQQADIVFLLFHPFHATGDWPALRKYQYVEVMILILDEFHILQLETMARVE